MGRARPDLLAPLTLARKEATMRDTGFTVLFICSGNSARSIFAEALLRDLGRAGSRRFGRNQARHRAEPLRAGGAAPQRPRHLRPAVQAHRRVSATRGPAMDFVFTVCDTAAAEECPPWPGQPITGHWGLPDPVKATGTDAEKALVFAQTYAALRRRILAFVELPFDSAQPDVPAIPRRCHRHRQHRKGLIPMPRIALNGLGRIGKLVLRDLIDTAPAARSCS
jgi:protein-tyrosine-phosphatase